MADAEIIPIGTRGRPGRGSGSMRPSSAARDLAPPAPRRPPPGKADAKAGGRARPVDAGSAAPDLEVGAGAQDDTADEPGPATTEERTPLPGIPVGDWWTAIRSAALGLWGHDWEGALAALLASWRRRLEGDYTVDDYGFDAEFTEQFVLAVLRPIAEKWFRIEVRGADNIPEDGGALIVSNHSGTVPVDAMMTGFVVHDETGRFLRPLGADLVFRLPVISSMARRTGSTLACNEDAERMLRGGELVGVWPEGFKGIGKPYTERYRLQRFGRGGFVSAAMRTGVPIVPLSVVGAEEIYPMVGSMPVLARILGVPYIPVTPTFPLLGPLGLVPLPSKWLMEFGEPIRTDELEDGAADDPMLVFDVTDQVRETIQQSLFTLLRERRTVFG